MMNVISPHLDDAVLSLGKFMQAESCAVHTMFARIPPPSYGVSAYDRSCGFESSAKAMSARKSEDVEALSLLGAAGRHHGFYDAQYEDAGGSEDWIGLLLEALSELMSPDVHTLVPLGIGHPDHALVSHYAQRAVPSGELLFYEELPYKVLHPEDVGDTLAVLRSKGWKLEAWPMPEADLHAATRKRHAIACYRSQYPNGPEDWLPLVPERIWRGVR